MKQALILFMLASTMIVFWCTNTPTDGETWNQNQTLNQENSWDNNQQNQNLANQEDDSDTSQDNQEYSVKYEWEENDTPPNTMKVVDWKGNTKLEYSIDQFNEWTKWNWDKFEEKPTVGSRDVKPGSFDYFDKTAKLWPDNKFLWFSTNDYAMATTTSFIARIDIDNKQVSMVKDAVRGEIDWFNFSPNWNHLSFTQSSARAEWDYLSIVNTDTMNVEIELSADDLFEDKEKIVEWRFIPEFDDFEWMENGEKLKFTTNSINNKNKINREISADWKNLKK